MSPSEIASHLPEWVIPEGTDLAQLRAATDQMVAEFSRPIRKYDTLAPASMSHAWSYTSKGTLDPSKWRASNHQGIPRVYICSAASQLRDNFAFTRVLQETIPHGSWVVEDSLLHNVFSASEIFKFSISTRRAVRREWLKLLKGKLNGTL